jgi:hypothetical protein
MRRSAFPSLQNKQSHEEGLFLHTYAEAKGCAELASGKTQQICPSSEDISNFANVKKSHGTGTQFTGKALEDIKKNSSFSN